VVGCRILKVKTNMSFIKKVGFTIFRFIFGIVGIRYLGSINDEYYTIKPQNINIMEILCINNEDQLY